MKLTKELTERLVLCKYLLLRAGRMLDSHTMFASGLTVLSLHDSLEMLLRIVGEHLNARIREVSAFSQIVEAIEDVSPCPLTHRTALNLLNKARVGFKHFGLEPTMEDARKLLISMEEFFPQTIEKILEVDFASLTLNSLVGHRRTENWLNKAEALLEEEKWTDSISASAIAFEVYRAHILPLAGSLDRQVTFQTEIAGARDMVDSINRGFRQLQHQIDLIIDGIDLRDFREFQKITPNVMCGYANAIIQVYWGGNRDAVSNRDSAQFCYGFALESILKFKDNHSPRTQHPWYPSDKRMLTVNECDIIVCPSEKPEVIRHARKGEVLMSSSKAKSLKGHIFIVQDGDEAYAVESALEELQEAVENDNVEDSGV